EAASLRRLRPEAADPPSPSRRGDPGRPDHARALPHLAAAAPTLARPQDLGHDALRAEPVRARGPTSRRRDPGPRAVRRLAASLGLALVLASPAASAPAVQATALRACGPSVCRSAGSGDMPKLQLPGRLPSSSPAPADFYWVQVSYRSGGAPTTRAYYYVPSENLLAGNADRQPNKLEWFRVRGGAATALGDLTAAL